MRPAESATAPVGPLASVRMRASRDGRHVSGAERLVPRAEADAVAAELRARAKARTPAPDYVRVRVDPVDPATVARVDCLTVTTVESGEPAEARALATAELRAAGVSDAAADAAFIGLVDGWHAGIPMRGAALVDRETGARLDGNRSRGTRASRFDYAPESRQAVLEALAAAGLGHFRTHEALALATKVLWAGVAAELCWSDDPEYVAGYVATPTGGYVRFDRFKPEGAVGGRAFFVDAAADRTRLIERLERAPLWIVGTPAVGATSRPKR